jgi:hypothetical protein
VELYLSPPLCPNGVVLNSLGTKTALILGGVISEKTVFVIFHTMLGQCMSEFSKTGLRPGCLQYLNSIKFYIAYV